jgi:hypothetical protein
VTSANNAAALFSLLKEATDWFPRIKLHRDEETGAYFQHEYGFHFLVSEIKMF